MSWLISNTIKRLYIEPFLLEKLLMLIKFKKVFLLFSFMLVGFSWLTPNHYLPYTTAYNDFSVFLALFFLGLYLLLNNINLKVPQGFVLLIALSTLPLLLWSLRENIFLGEALVSSIYVVGFSFAFFIAFNLAKESEKVKLEILMTSIQV